MYLKFLSARNSSGQLTVEELQPVMVKLKNLGEILTAEEIRAILGESFSNKNDDIDFESFLRVSQWKMVFPGIFLFFYSLNFEILMCFTFGRSIGSFNGNDLETAKKKFVASWHGQALLKMPQENKLFLVDF